MLRWDVRPCSGSAIRQGARRTQEAAALTPMGILAASHSRRPGQLLGSLLLGRVALIPQYPGGPHSTSLPAGRSSTGSSGRGGCWGVAAAACMHGVAPAPSQGRGGSSAKAVDGPSSANTREVRIWRDASHWQGPLSRSHNHSHRGGPLAANATSSCETGPDRTGEPGVTDTTSSCIPVGHLLEGPTVDDVGTAAATAASTSAPPGGSVGVSPDEIARRIAASRARRAAKLSYKCPACTISAATPVNIARHMARCCPDLMGPEGSAWDQLDSLPRGYPSPQHDLAVSLLRAAGARELELRKRVLACVFWSGPTDPETGLPSRLEVEAAASELGLPPARASSLLQRAMASVPLASDSGGPPLEVLYEDEHFLAVNKPVGLHTAPIHRFTGGSVVNQVIAYLNRGRQGAQSGGDHQVTLLSPTIADVPYGFLPPLMPLPEPFTLASTTSSSSDGGTGSSDDEGSSADALVSASSANGGVPYQLEPYVLHRLDMNTSGLLLFAKRREVVAGMHRQFRERTLSKFYVAAAVGCPHPAGGRFDVDAPIDRHPTDPVARVVAPSGKEACTSFAVMASNPDANLGPAAGGAPGMLFHDRNHPNQPHGLHDPSLGAATTLAATTVPSGSDGDGGGSEVLRGASLVVCAPHSGRTHQIRVHLHHVGHPIVGDDIYGITGPWLARQALHAAALRFTHPLTGCQIALAAPLHDDMAACLRALGLPLPEVGRLAEEWRELTEAGGTGGDGGGGGKHGKRPRRGGREGAGGRRSPP